MTWAGRRSSPPAPGTASPRRPATGWGGSAAAASSGLFQKLIFSLTKVFEFV